MSYLDNLHKEVQFLRRKNEELYKQVVKLKSQLPKGMKHCTIVFKECSQGHGRLTATNWVDHGCLFCRDNT